MKHHRIEKYNMKLCRAFSLVELVIVVMIIGIVSAIAVPRITQASNRAASSALESTLTTVRKAIDIYYAEHQRYPGHDVATFAPSHIAFIDQLDHNTDTIGNTNQAYSSTFKYGPYIRKPFPRNPFNLLKTVYVKANPSDSNPSGADYGWVAVLSTGDFGVIATDQQLEDIGITDPARKQDLVKY